MKNTRFFVGKIGILQYTEVAFMENLFKIAKKSLQACYVEDGMIASPKNFGDFWARDTFWALPGMLASGDAQEARKNIDLFLMYQRHDGKIPRKIMRERTMPKYIFGKVVLRKIFKSCYKGIIPLFHSMDDNALFVRAMWSYLEKTNDVGFVRARYEQVYRAMFWYEKKKQEGLIYEGPLASWMDTILKSGKVLYANVLYAEALRCFSQIAQRLEKEDDVHRFQLQYERSKELIQQKFWNGSYYVDRAGLSLSEDYNDHFDVAGNILACYFGIASPDRSGRILETLQARAGDKTFVQTVYPLYPFWRINLFTYLLGMSDYHNGISWLWIDLFRIEVEFRYGDRIRAEKHLAEVGAVVGREGEVGETYFSDGTVYKKTFWESASPFAWSSGVLLEILSRRNKEEDTV